MAEKLIFSDFWIFFGLKPHWDQIGLAVTEAEEIDREHTHKHSVAIK